MNSTTITKKNEEANYPAHYPSEAFSTNKSICVRNNLLQKSSDRGGNALNWCSEGEEACHALQRDAKPRVSHDMSNAEGSPKQACDNTSFESNMMPSSFPMICAKGADSPCWVPGSLDHHLAKQRGQEAASG